jgi:hypothetical protein
MTHDTLGRRTLTLFATGDRVEARLLGICMPPHRQQDGIGFRELVERLTPVDVALHRIVSYSAARKRRWMNQRLGRHARFPAQVLPAGRSPLHPIGWRLGGLTDGRLRGAVRHLVRGGIGPAAGCVAPHHQNPATFRQTAHTRRTSPSMRRGADAFHLYPGESLPRHREKGNG